MGSSINVTTDVLKADPYAWKNVLALPLISNINDVHNLMGVDQQNQLQEMVMLSPIIHSAISMVAVITLMEVWIL